MSRLRPFLIPCSILSLLLFATVPALAQPKQDAPKLPPIDPNQARLEQTFNGLDGPGLALAASETVMMVAAACDRGAIHLWHKDSILGLRDGSNSVNVLTGHAGPVLDLAWTGGGKLASVGADRKIMLWNALEGKLLNTFDCSFLVRGMEMSPDGKLLACAGDLPAVQLLSMETGKPARELKGHTDWLLCVRFSDDGKQIVSGGYDGQAILWDVGSGNKVRELVPPEKKDKAPPDIVTVTAVALSPDGKQALVGRADGEIDQVNVADGKKIRTLKGHTSAVASLLYHPEGKLAVSSSKDGTIRLWNPANGGAIKELKDHTAWVEDITLIADGTRLVSVGADQTVRIWNLQAP
jgi:WD40 repeat protein